MDNRDWLQENWLTMFCSALARIADGSDYMPYLSRARQRAEAEGRRADIDCVVALAYAAAGQDEPVLAAELIGHRWRALPRHRQLPTPHDHPGPGGAATPGRHRVRRGDGARPRPVDREILSEHGL